MLTGAHNGTVKLWNFNNGACMHSFSRLNFEITHLVYLPRGVYSVMGVGWSDKLIRWLDPQTTREHVTIFFLLL